MANSKISILDLSDIGGAVYDVDALYLGGVDAAHYIKSYDCPTDSSHKSQKIWSSLNIGGPQSYIDYFLSIHSAYGGRMTINSQGDANDILIVKKFNDSEHRYLFTSLDETSNTTETLATREWVNNQGFGTVSGEVDLSNYVTLNSAQTITGSKTFLNTLQIKRSDDSGGGSATITIDADTGRFILQPMEGSQSEGVGFSTEGNLVAIDYEGDPRIRFKSGVLHGPKNATSEIQFYLPTVSSKIDSATLATLESDNIWTGSNQFADSILLQDSGVDNSKKVELNPNGLSIVNDITFTSVILNSRGLSFCGPDVGAYYVTYDDNITYQINDRNRSSYSILCELLADPSKFSKLTLDFQYAKLQLGDQQAICLENTGVTLDGSDELNLGGASATSYSLHTPNTFYLTPLTFDATDLTTQKGNLQTDGWDSFGIGATHITLGKSELGGSSTADIYLSAADNFDISAGNVYCYASKIILSGTVCPSELSFNSTTGEVGQVLQVTSQGQRWSDTVQIWSGTVAELQEKLADDAWNIVDGLAIISNSSYGLLHYIRSNRLFQGDGIETLSAGNFVFWTGRISAANKEQTFMYVNSMPASDLELDASASFLTYSSMLYSSYSSSQNVVVFYVTA